MIWCGEVQQKGRPKLGAPPPPRPPYPSQHHHHRCHHQMTHYHNCLIRRQDGQQDPPQGPPYPLPDRSQQCSLVIGLLSNDNLRYYLGILGQEGKRKIVLQSFTNDRNEMVRNQLEVATMQVNVRFLQQLQPEWSRFMTIVKQTQDLDKESYHELFDILKQYQEEVNEFHAEKIARHTGKEISKPITPLFESASEEDSNLEQAQRDKEMQKNLVLIVKYFKKLYKPTNNNLRTSSNSKNKKVDTTPRYVNENHTGQFRNQRIVTVAGDRETIGSQEKMLMCKQAEKGVQLQVEQADWLEDTDEEVDEQELEVHYSFMAKIQEVLPADSGSDAELLEKVGSNVIPNSLNMCDNDNQADQNAKELVDQDWEKHSHDHFRSPTAHDIEILIKTFLMPLALKTQNDSFTFVHELKQEMHDDLTFAKLEKHSITLELAFQQCQEQMKNDTVCKEKASNVFLIEREQYFKIQDLKAQLQDKNNAMSELKKLIEKCKRKSVETKFDKPSVVRQPNAQRIPKLSVLGKLTPFSDYLERKSFSKTKSVPKTNVLEGVIHRTNVSKPQLRSTQIKDKVVPNNSQVKFKKTEVEDHHRISSISTKTKSVTACNDSLKSRTSNVNVVCATCGKCVFNSNHDACVSKFLNDVNARTKKPKVVPISNRQPKSQANKSITTPPKKTAASESTIQNSKSSYRKLYEKTSKAWKW
ncbi:hypothetical protein Tco_1019139 [Tanacetum coccineum]|uniref:Uncharacterized protein n=1 Tax=Tanacetum coccineum TaxID=301880 RepID=A0ABQ5FWL0_9ASTR